MLGLGFMIGPLSHFLNEFRPDESILDSSPRGLKEKQACRSKALARAAALLPLLD